MSEASQSGQTDRGVLAFFTRHRNASNLVMLVVLMAGFYGLRQMNRQFFPSVEIPVVSVSIEWPGAAASDVEVQILDLAGPVLRELDGVKRIEGSAYEGVGRMRAEFHAGTDLQQITSDVESAINRIDNFPEEAKKPVVTRASFFENITSILITGPFEEKALKRYARTMRDELLALGLDRVEFSSLRDEEIWIEADEQALRRFGLTPTSLAQRIGAAGADTPSGTLGGISERQLRTEGRMDDIRALAQMEVIAGTEGQKVRLGELAHLRESFAERQPRSSKNGRPAIRINIQRANANNSLDTLEASDKIDEWLKQAGARYPASLTLTRFDAQGDLVRQRIAMLMRNMAGGLILVVGVLFLFLNAGTAFWVAAGILITMIASCSVLYLIGESINMISLFAFLMMLGIVVDDAIVVGEEAASQRERGLSPQKASLAGVRVMAAPVFASSLTTIAAFMPILLLQDVLGEIMHTMAIVVIVVILASLVEAFFILPGHLRESLKGMKPIAERAREKPKRWRLNFRKRFQAGFDHLRDGAFVRLATFSYDRRYSVIALSLAVLLTTIGLMSSGRTGFRFFPSPEGEALTAHFIFAPGTPREQVEEALLEAQEVLLATEESLAVSGEYLIKTWLAHSAQAGGDGGGPSGGGGGGQGDNRGQIFVELTPSETRRVRTRDFLEAWRANMPDFAGLSRLTIIERRPGPPGSDIDIEISGADAETLKRASLDIQDYLRQFSSVTDMRDNLPYGKRELVFDITARGHALGFTAQSVGQQLRGAYQGAVARRFTQGAEEITIRVRLDEDTAQSLSAFYLTAPSGARVALREVVSIDEKTGFARIERLDGARTTSLRADVLPGGLPPAAIIASLEENSLPEIKRQHGVEIGYGGRAEEQASAFGELRIGLILALLMIYLILAWIFGDYTRPIAIMSIIPFGLIGAVFGHMVMGYDITILTFVALLGLSGILVNDSIVLVSRIETRKRLGESTREAVIFGSRDRLRAVILTSVTTVVGLTPLMFETSLQAQFLKPIAITLSFGITGGTFLVLLLVPAVLGVQEDFSRRRAPEPQLAE